jgi:purine-binding chemotaxis protein CheW
MAEKKHFILFSLAEQKFALPLVWVDKIVRSVAVRSLPKAPEMILGVINLQGRIVPIVSLRKRFGLEEKPIGVDDHLIVCRTSDRPLALLVDNVADIIEIEESRIIHQESILKGMDYIEGVLKMEDGMILIHDLERVLSGEESARLNQALLREGTADKPEASGSRRSGKGDAA